MQRLRRRVKRRVAGGGMPAQHPPRVAPRLGRLPGPVLATFTLARRGTAPHFRRVCPLSRLSVTAPPSSLGNALRDRYTIERELGRGGMATVYLAQDLKHGRFVALKVLHPELSAGVGPGRFRREVETAARLEHPHILPVLDSGESDGWLWYTMPYVEGESLRARMDRAGALPLDEALRLVCEVADALHCAHRHGVVHRDVKPENILLSGGHARVADFGIAKALEAAGDERLTGTGLAVGTPHYMSPEQASGGRILDARSDIYSLGCVLYEVLTGEPPFTGRTPQAVMTRRLFESPTPVRRLRPTVSAGVEGAIVRALALEPADRFQTAAEFARALTDPAETPPAMHPAPSTATALPAAGATGLRRKPLLMASALLLLLIVLAVWLADRRPESPRSGSGGGEPTSIAVLPFSGLGLDPEDEYLSDGITEDLINLLGRAPGLRVVARTSAFTFKGKAEDVRKVGAQLDVDAVVEGSVRKVGDTLRITAQLVNVADGYQLWGDRYERPSADLLSLEDDLSRAVLRALGTPATVGLDTSPAGAPTQSPEAYKLFLKGRYHLGKMTEGDYRTALKYFDQAVGLDPTFALAYSGMSDAYGALYGTFLPTEEGMPKAKASALRALELDPSLAEAYVSLGSVQMSYEWDWQGAEQSFRRAVELKPSYASARHLYGYLLVILGRFDEAAMHLDRARQLDPLSMHIEVTAVWPLYYRRKFGEAIEALSKTVAADSSFVGAQFRLGEAYALSGQFGAAEARLQAARQLIGDHADLLGRLGYVYAKSGRREKARAIADSLHARYRKGRSDEPYDLALVYIGLGDKERALDWLETAFAERSTWLAFTKVSPELDPLRDEPRFRRLLERLRLG
jgi:serine/threonine protein kinase/tetratricopeptide (TPR) repeat protein